MQYQHIKIAQKVSKIHYYKVITMIEQYIDHTNLKQTATIEDILDLCTEAHEAGFATVCIPPCFVTKAKQFLKDSHTKVCTVIGFPFGYSTTKTKTEEIISAIEDGADEIDIVQNVTNVKSGKWDEIKNEIYECLRAAKRVMTSENKLVVVKVILESGILTDKEIKKCCKIYGNYNTYDGDILKISFIKTSTGFAANGASVHQVDLIKANIPDTMEIKASGGIRTFAFANELIKAGATRLGCSAGIQIALEANNLASELLNDKDEY